MSCEVGMCAFSAPARRARRKRRRCGQRSYSLDTEKEKFRPPGSTLSERCQELGIVRKRAVEEDFSTRQFGQFLLDAFADCFPFRPARDLGHDRFHNLAMVFGAGGLGFSDDLVNDCLDLGLGKGLGEVR